MPRNGWYTGDSDNVTDDGNVNGWADLSGQAFGNSIAGGLSYRFGSVINNYGTWGQLIYATKNDLAAEDLSNPSGLNGNMPSNPGPGNSNWVQGHLVNGECGGSGNKAAYLTPITGNLNKLHAGYEAVLQRLVNRGSASGSSTISFNPNKIPNSRLIYRTHGLTPPAPGGFTTVPKAICVSLGIVINGLMKSEADVQNEFNNPGTTKWFADRYYKSEGKSDRDKIIQMIGGVELGY
ncbi:MAG: hypothetical protein F6K50_13835 [Moorea sp. SIO3I7]|uniref:hypothetical protein n=1 Tax=unclassified Moorena TaxID=2683338 RepID=UPI0013BF34EC|nr:MULTISPECIES: hypothetical protein [unclassified Moorena]NEN96573.1 hypothetical protein [Moorena sp. SIO3I7]NEO05016.1 hypothetical protein [Moorena sp. SIO3I8]NEO22493.1 hypothetical protein [Moorena sp. SIO4A5]NEP21347.1 hypothetical protein [Moorena sp. SIO3I6]NEQ56875.1 hypothetical protein [Moorena sp. SIO4A1]